MSEPRARGAAPDFTELWRNVCTLSDETHERASEQQHAAGASTMCTDLRSPKHRGCSRYAGWSTGDSPGDAEPSQDIFWDPTSPPSAAAGLRNSRFVEISDIVNRIAPKDVKRKPADSPLLQWIGDSAVPCTQGVPKPRPRKRSSRPSSVDDLLKLARQFDENMQQDRETSERLHADRAGAPEPKPADARFPSDPKCPPSSDPVEAELRLLFDCSTQKVSGRLSQGSSASAPQPSAEHRQPELHPAGGSGPASPPAGGNASCGFKANDCDDFDDDWEDDDLLSDSLVLEMSHAPQRGAPHEAALQGNTETTAEAFTSVCEPAARSAPSRHPKPSALQDLCPEPKTSNRSSFKLEPNPHFQTTKVPGSGGSLHTEPKTSDLKPAAAKTPSIPIPDKTKTQTCGAAVSSDSLWDDGVDDALLYQACDRVERTSSRTPAHEARSGNADTRQSAFVRSNSLPGGSGEPGNYQGWGAPMKGGDSKSGMSQSLPGGRVSLGSFNRIRDAAGPLRSGVDGKPRAATSTSHQPAGKRGVADPAAVSSKVFVTSQMPLKCSAAEIGRKKQEALARRRLRLQNAPKP